jgi:hypothetical protein
MSRSKVLLVAVVVAVLGLGAGASLAATGARSEQAPAPTPQALGPTTSHDLEFVPVDPCRLADTRQGGGIVGTNATRNFLVTGSAGFPAQGGTSGGCGVPEGALAAELTIISADATAPGFLRAYPFGGSPSATFLAYQNGPNLLNTGTVALCEGTCASDLSVKSFQASTQVIIDVNGYYMPNRFASVDGAGALLNGARVEDTERVSEGVYTVTFDSSVEDCALVASPSDTTNQADLWARVSAGDPTVVEVDIENPANPNTQQDNEFFLHVVC